MNENYVNVEAKIYNLKFWISECNPKFLRDFFQDKLTKVKFNILLFNEYHFPEKGYTCFWLLAESHLAIHTFPESNKTYIELSSCNKEKLDLFNEIVKDNVQKI